MAVRTPNKRLLPRLLPRDQAEAVSMPSTWAFESSHSHDSIPPSSTKSAIYEGKCRRWTKGSNPVQYRD